MWNLQGVSKSYYKPTEKVVLEDYLKAAPSLSISQDHLALQRQMQDLEEKSKDTDSVVKAKDEDIKSMKEKYDNDIALLKESISEMKHLLKNPEKLAQIAKA
jgi:hypothetical protein